jgi:hypothetical protein
MQVWRDISTYSERLCVYNWQCILKRWDIVDGEEDVDCVGLQYLD